MGKKKKLIAKIIFVAVLLAIIIYTFRDSAGPIFQQVAETSVKVIIGVCVMSVIYHFFEGWVTFSLAKRYTPEITYFKGVGCAFYCSFYRLATLGSGTGVAAIYYLGKFGVGYSEGIGLYLVQYIMHKVSIALFSGVLFLLNWPFMMENYSDYAVWLILAFGLTFVIALLLELLIVSPKFHKVILKLFSVINHSGRFDKMEKKLGETAVILETTSTKLVKDRGTLVSVVLKDLVKLCFWYGIPFLVLYETGLMTFPQVLAVTSLSVMTAAVIPTPVGIGALELIMTGLFSVVAGVELGGAITLIYRFGTFFFPFLVGSVFVILSKFRLYKHR